MSNGYTLPGGVSADATHEIINRYLVAAGVNSYQMSKLMGRHQNYIYGVQGHQTVRPKTELFIFDWIDANWPNNVSRPRLLADFTRNRTVFESRALPGGRKCMACADRFESDGPHNRLCAKCNRRASSLGNEFT